MMMNGRLLWRCDIQAHRPTPRLDVCRVDHTWLRPVDCWTASSEERWERCGGVREMSCWLLTLVSCGSFFFCWKRVNIVNKIESRLSWHLVLKKCEKQPKLRLLFCTLRKRRSCSASYLGSQQLIRNWNNDTAYHAHIKLILYLNFNLYNFRSVGPILHHKI